MKPEVRVALCGLGRIGLMHLENISGGLRYLRLAGVFDENRAKAESIADENGVEAFASYEDLLDSDQIDAVVLTTPTQSHPAMSVQAATAGKHVFCEKPLALTLSETLSAVEELDACPVVFQIGFHRRFDPDWQEVYARARKGDLGEVVLFRSSMRDMASPPTSFLATSGGPFVDFAIHDLDAARWICGEISEVTAYGAGAQGGDPDTTVIVLRFASGGLGIIDNARNAVYGYEASAEIMGSRATARIGDVHSLSYTWRTPSKVETPLPLDYSDRFFHAYRRELEAFGRAVARREPSPVGTFDASSAMTLAIAAQTSLLESRTVGLDETPTRM